MIRLHDRWMGLCAALFLILAVSGPTQAADGILDPIRASDEFRQGLTRGERPDPRPRPAPRLVDPSAGLPPGLSLQVLPASHDPAGKLPVSLAGGDLDRDGVPELIAGYRAGETGVLVVKYGQRAGRTYELPASPDFVVSGDFDNDGLVDVVLASRAEQALFFLRGEGAGILGPARRRALPGKVTALIAGEINRRDGLADLIVAVTRENASEVLVFEGPTGALNAEPERLALGEPATSLALGQLDDDYPHELVVTAGHSVAVIHGRDRWLSTDPELRPRTVPPMELHVHDLGRPVEAVAVGDFAWEARQRSEIAVLLEDGTVEVLDHSHGSPSRTWTRVGAARIERENPTEGLSMLTTRLTRTSTEDLLVLDRGNRQAVLLGGMARDEATAGQFGVHEVESLSGAPVAALSLRLDDDAGRDLVLLHEDDPDPQLHLSEEAAVIVVNSPIDPPAPPPGDGSCTFREALRNANMDADTTAGDCAAGSGLDSISFNIAGGGAPASIAIRGALPPISDPVVIDGTTQGCPTPPCIALTGVFAGAGTGALELTADGTTIRGLSIFSFDGDGIVIRSRDNVVEGCHIGVDIAGTTAPGNTGAGIVIDNGSANRIGGNTAAQRNVLSANDAGVRILAGSVDNQIVGNYAGTDVTGTVAFANVTSGIEIDGASDNFVGGTAPGEGNLASGNLLDGVTILPGGSGNLVHGNVTGLDSGDLPLANAEGGIVFDGSSGNTAGGTAAGAGNVASSNGFAGIIATDFSTGVLPTFNVIQGNLVGLDTTGTVARPNGAGIGGIMTFPADDTLIGGNVAAARNVAGTDATACIWIAGNRNIVQGNYAGTDVTGTVALNAAGLVSVVLGEAPEVRDTVVLDNVIASGDAASLILQFVTSGSDVRRNLIGTDATGTVALGSNGVGVQIQGVDVLDNTIGSSLPGEGNVISGHAGSGVRLVNEASSNRILGNSIGTDVSGGSLANGSHGVAIIDAGGNSIGGTAPGEGNTIAFNMGAGISIEDPAMPATGNRILGNSIDDNSALGIDLAADGVTANDAADPDGGPNSLQNFPVLLNAEVGLGSTTIQADIDSTPATNLRVEFFTSPACDGSGYGEGSRFLGAADVTTDAAGVASVDTTVLMPAVVGGAVSATATGPDGTSEFAECIAAAACPALTPLGQTLLPAAGGTQFGWAVPADVRFVRGPLAGVGSYAISGGGAATAATMIDVSADTPSPGTGLWYLVRPLACGSWQTMSGAEPARDGGPLP